MKILKFNQMSDLEPINEELLGGLVNFFKGLWKKLSAELKKIDNDPNNIKEFVSKQILNPTSNNSIFKNELAKFRANKTLNDQAIFDFMSEIFDKTTGVLGVQGIGNLFNDSSLKGEDMKGKRLAIEYIINTTRDYEIKKLKFDQKKDNSTIRKRGKFVDTNWLGPLKAQIPDPNKIDANKVVTWITNNVFADMQRYSMSLREDDIREAVKKGGGDLSGTGMNYDKLKEFFDKKTPVIYLRKDKKMSDYDANKKPEEQKDVIGVKVINALDDQNTDKSVTFLDEEGNPSIKKSYAEIIGPAEGAKGTNVQKAKVSLGKIANDEEKMGQVAKYADFIQNDANKDKIEQINKILGT